MGNEVLDQICAKYTFDSYDVVIRASKEYIRNKLGREIKDLAELAYVECLLSAGLYFFDGRKQEKLFLEDMMFWLGKDTPPLLGRPGELWGRRQEAKRRLEKQGIKWDDYGEFNRA